MIAEVHARFDHDRDGIIDAEEYALFSPRGGDFAALDLNGDGGIDTTEFGTFLDTVPPRPIYGGRTRPVAPPDRAKVERRTAERGGRAR